MPEIDRGVGSPGHRCREFFEGIWKQGDFWKLESSEFERQKYERQIALLDRRDIARALEIGCGAGTFTELLAQRAGDVLAIDVSPTAIARARRDRQHLTNVEFRVADVMEFDLGTPQRWDLIVLSETIYYLGWLHSFFDVSWLAARIFKATSPGGRFLMANTLGLEEDYLLRPWVIRTYHDLFSNLGFAVEREEIVSGLKDGCHLETLVTLYVKAENTREKHF